MKKSLFLGLCAGLLLFQGQHLLAQADRFSHQVTIGATFPLLSQGIGAHIAYVPAWSLHSFVGIQSQVSYSYTAITSAFISGATGYHHSLNLLAGPRVFLRGEAKKLRPYVFAMAGVNRVVQNYNGETDPAYLSFGFSTGVMVEFKPLTAGITAETPGVILLRLGYII